MLFYMIVHAQRRHCWLSPFAFLLSLVDCVCVCVSAAMLAKQGSTETGAYISMVCPASMLTWLARKARLLTAIKYADTANISAFPIQQIGVLQNAILVCMRYHCYLLVLSMLFSPRLFRWHGA